MVYTASHVLFKVNGTFGATSTAVGGIWSYGFRIPVATGPLSEATKIAFLGFVEGAVKTFHTGAPLSAGTNCYLTKLTAAYIGTDGLYLGGDSQPTTEFLYSPPQPGVGGNITPFEMSAAISMFSTIDRGRGSRGRFYAPTSRVVASDGRWSASERDSLSAASKALVDAINTAAETAWPTSGGVSVMSRLDAGVTAPVIKISSGRSPDSQRRRDRQLPEEYAPLSLATTGPAAETVSAREYA